MRRNISLCISGILILSFWFAIFYYGAESIASYLDYGVFTTNPVRLAISLLEAIYLAFWWNRGWKERETIGSSWFDAMVRKTIVWGGAIVILILWIVFFCYGVVSVMSYYYRGVFDVNPVLVGLSLIGVLYLKHLWERYRKTDNTTDLQQNK